MLADDFYDHYLLNLNLMEGFERRLFMVFIYLFIFFGNDFFSSIFKRINLQFMAHPFFCLKGFYYGLASSSSSLQLIHTYLQVDLYQVESGCDISHYN